MGTCLLGDSRSKLKFLLIFAFVLRKFAQIKMSLHDKILKRKLKKKEKQKLKIIEDRKSNTNNDFVEETEMSSEEKVEIVGSDVENQGLKRKLDETIEDPETP